jgi:hypothetical protein
VTYEIPDETILVIPGRDEDVLGKHGCGVIEKVDFFSNCCGAPVAYAYIPSYLGG